MAIAPVTYASLSEEQTAYFYDKILLEYAKKNLPHAAFGQRARTITIPLHSGVNVQFRKMTPLAVATTALSEGQTPVGKELAVSEETCTVAEYGDFIRYTAFIEKTAIDPIVAELAKLLGYQCGLTIDTLARNALVASNSAQYASTATATTEVTSTMYLTAAEIMEALATLGTNDARPFDDGKYIGIMSPKTQYDFLQDSTVMNTFLHATEPGKENPLYTHKWGTWMNVDWFVTSNAYVNSLAGYGSLVDVATTLIIAKDAYGCGGLAGDIPTNFASSQQDPNTGKEVSPVTMKIVEAGTATPSDPLGQRGSVGWITTFVPKVLDTNWLVGIQHANRL